jgi:hypothetical protein
VAGTRNRDRVPLAFHAVRDTLSGMTTLTTFRDRLRIDLRDPGSLLWDDDALDRHIERALRDLSSSIPREAQAILATTAGSRDVDIASLEGLVDVEHAEYPIDRFPPELATFSRWVNTLSLHTASVPTGDNLRVYYTAQHVVDDEGSTVPAHLEDVLGTGAGAYAVLERAHASVNVLNTGGPAVPRELEAQGRAWMTAFRELLRHHARANRVRTRRLFVPA